MRISINETGSEQLENQHLPESSSELESKDSEITDAERKRLSETTPDMEGIKEDSGDASAKLDNDGPRLDMDKQKTENTSSVKPVDEGTAEQLDSQESDQADKAPSLSEAMNDPKLFTDHKPKDYKYTENANGKQAYGQLGLSDDPHRNPKAQLEAGGDERREDDDGGHLIGSRFDGSPNSENIDAQNRNLNRGGYKCEENSWAEALKNDDKLYANIETYKRDGAERPDAYMGWTVTEHPDGSRDWDAFSFTNESNEEQAKWAEEIDKLPDTADVPNAMLDDNYDRIHQIIDEEAENR